MIQSKTESVKLGGSDAVISHLGLLGLTSTLVTRCTKLLLTEQSVYSVKYIFAPTANIFILVFCRNIRLNTEQNKATEHYIDNGVSRKTISPDHNHG